MLFAYIKILSNSFQRTVRADQICNFDPKNTEDFDKNTVYRLLSESDETGMEEICIGCLAGNKQKIPLSLYKLIRYTLPNVCMA